MQQNNTVKSNYYILSLAAMIVASVGCVVPVNAQMTVQVTEGEGMTLDSVSDCIAISAYEIDMGIAEDEDPANYERELGNEMAAINDDVKVFVDASFRETNRELAAGLEIFSNWYVQHLETLDAEDKTERAIAGFIGNALSVVLDAAFPGTGQVSRQIREWGATTYEEIYSSTTRTSERSPQVFLQYVIANMQADELRREAFVDYIFNTIDNDQVRVLLDGVRAVEAMARRRGGGPNNMNRRERRLHHCAGMILSRVGINRSDQSNIIRRYFVQSLIKQVKCAQYDELSIASKCSTDVGNWNATRESGIETRRLFNEPEPHR